MKALKERQMSELDAVSQDLATAKLVDEVEDRLSFRSLEAAKLSNSFCNSVARNPSRLLKK